MSTDGSLRASDSDRDRVVERLRAAAGEGRLAAEELDERVHSALTARTYSELAATTRDLPQPHGSRGPRGRRSATTPVPTADARPSRSSRRQTVGGVAVTALRANPLLIVFLIPLVAVTGAMLVAVSTVWALFAIVALALGARRDGSPSLPRGPWTLIWDPDDRR